MSKKEQIIKTAMKLFVENGFENTPTSLISQKSETSVGTLFHHFRTKEDLINEIYVYVKKNMSSSMYQNIKGSSKNQIKVIWTNIIIWAYKNQDESKFLEKFYGSSYINNLTRDQVNSYFEKGAIVFQKAVEEKVIKKMSIELFANLTFGLLHVFEKEFYKYKNLDVEFINLSYKIYWNAIKR